MNIEIKNSNYTTQEKLQILADAAKYDVACTSSGSSRRGKKGELGNTEACGICHSFAADGRCISQITAGMDRSHLSDGLQRILPG